jgi:hypothetical protein
MPHRGAGDVEFETPPGFGALLPGVVAASLCRDAFHHLVLDAGIVPELIGLFDLVSTIR